MAGESWEPNTVPKVVGGFNIPKTVIETKVDTLAFLELLLRKGLATDEEIDEIRAAVVAHLNVMYPELRLSYSTPPSLQEAAPIEPPKATPSQLLGGPLPGTAPAQGQTPAAPLFLDAPPPKFI